MEPLRIGVLGCARITGLALADPARAIGARLVAVGARDAARAAAFADRHAVERVVADYDALVHDAEVEVVYNPLVNAWHGPWNVRALEAGKHVLTEKPSASNAEEARVARTTALTAGRHLVEAFHYRHHPLAQRMLELATDGTIGDLVAVDASLSMPPPKPEDARWSFDLSGGAGMDLGCYAVHSLRTIAAALGGEPAIESATALCSEHDDRVDARLEAALTLPGGVPARVLADMTAPDVAFAWRLEGTRGRVDVPALIQPHEDDRLLLTRDGRTVVEQHGRRSSYTYQLDALTRLVREDAPAPASADDAVATMELLDAIYTAAGLPLRPTAGSDPAVTGRRA